MGTYLYLFGRSKTCSCTGFFYVLTVDALRFLIHANGYELPQEERVGLELLSELPYSDEEPVDSIPRKFVL